MLENIGVWGIVSCGSGKRKKEKDKVVLSMFTAWVLQRHTLHTIIYLTSMHPGHESCVLSPYSRA